MAVTHISFVTAMDRGQPTLAAIPAESETLTANGTTTITAKSGQVCLIASDIAVFVAFGATPDASTEPRQFIPAGSTRDFNNLGNGHKVAVLAV